MKKTYQTILLIILCIVFSTTAFANEKTAQDSNVVLRALPCDECGEAMIQSNATMSILTKQVKISCGCVYGQPGVGDDFKNTYNVYNTYVCSGCGYTLPRNYITQQTKYWCIEASVFYNPITGFSIGETSTNLQNEEESIEILRGISCDCGYGALVPSSDLILSDNYIVQSRTLQCKEFPYIPTRRDEVWRYYFYNTYVCNYCGSVYLRDKTQYYEEWGFCSHGSGKYLLNVVQIINNDLIDSESFK